MDEGKEMFLIKEGNELRGEIEVYGAKNAALKIFAASILFNEPIIVKNVPEIEDIARCKELLEFMGGRVQNTGKREYKISSNLINSSILEPKISKSMRSSIVFTGPMLAKFDKVEFPHPGGCVIGERPIDVFLEGFEKLGAKITIQQNGYILEAKKLRGAKIIFKKISVTATETLMMAAALAEGKTILYNSALEPEIPALADFLNSCGAKIKGAGTYKIEITGVKNLKFKNPYVIIPDRIEAGSFAILAAILGKEIKITRCEPNHLLVFLEYLKYVGAEIEKGKNFLKISSPKKLKSIDVKTREYPGFPTDLQAPFVALLTQAEGKSIVTETIFEGRLNYIEDLNRMGAKIMPCDPRRIIIEGKTDLRGKEMESPDLRAGLAFVLAALCAKGESIIHGVYKIDRGYEKIEKRLQKLGADIERIKS